MAQDKTIYRPSPDESVSVAVVKAVADVKGIDPVDLDDQLYDYVDPSALDRLFEPPGARSPRSCRVSFVMAGCRVDIGSPRKITVTPQFEHSSAANTVTS